MLHSTEVLPYLDQVAIMCIQIQQITPTVPRQLILP